MPHPLFSIVLRSIGFFPAQSTSGRLVHHFCNPRRPPGWVSCAVTLSDNSGFAPTGGHIEGHDICIMACYAGVVCSPVKRVRALPRASSLLRSVHSGVPGPATVLHLITRGVMRQVNKLRAVRPPAVLS